MTARPVGALAVPVHGARHLGAGRTRFALWAPARAKAELRVVAPYSKTVAMSRSEDGFHSVTVENAPPGTRYRFRLDGAVELPDPASLFQPEGVDGPSEVVETAFVGKAHYWTGLPLADYVLYELHVGTFTKEGTFDAAARQLSRLRDLGVTAVELMPVAQFPGRRGWGYDGVYPSAAHDGYGGPDGLRRFVDAAHQRGLAVVLDAVYNHLGPEGCRLPELGPYLKGGGGTPWGDGPNFDGPESDFVRAFFIQSALWWLEDCGVDALRLDAASAIPDLSERPFLGELAEAVQAMARRTGRLVYLIAEHLRNDARVVRPREMGGLGLDAQWCDDLHHALHACLTGERAGPLADFGTAAALERSFAEGWLFDGTARSSWRRRTLGTPSGGLPGRRFVQYWQNHDQVGNRPGGERAAALASLETHKLGLGAVLLSPYLPLLFMGDEHAERRPFRYFADFKGEGLRADVRAGRARELASHWGWTGEASDPFAAGTFESSVLDQARPRTPVEDRTAAFVRELLRLRREHPAFKEPGRERMTVGAVGDPPVLVVGRGAGAGVVLMNFGDTPHDGPLPVPAGRWRLVLDSADDRWGGAGAAATGVLASAGEAAVRLAPRSLAVYEAMGGAA